MFEINAGDGLKFFDLLRRSVLILGWSFGNKKYSLPILFLLPNDDR